ncbi:MAG: acyl carrier protein [Deltaproteobacteria bacterium]|nr:acyl carrier protein [Deltaproteobacteria bacterium]
MSTTEQLRKFICESFFVETFGDDDSFLRTGIIDSMGMLQLVAFVEDTFGVEVEDEELVPANFESLTKVVAFVEGKRQRRSA